MPKPQVIYDLRGRNGPFETHSFLDEDEMPF